jgi:hypothetical protein
MTSLPEDAPFVGVIAEPASCERVDNEDTGTCEIVTHLLPKVSLDETSQRVHQGLSVLRQRLQVAQSGLGDLNGVAMPSSALLGDSGTS